MQLITDVDAIENDVQKEEVTELSCPSCGSGVMLERRGRYGKFWGCSAFPSCKQTLQEYQVIKLKKLSSEPVKTFTPTDEQQAIYDWTTAKFLGNSRSLIVEACAGSGKTFTIEQAIKLLKAQNERDIIYLVFNAKNREEAQGKGLPAKTTHQHGYAALRKYCKANKLGNPQLVDSKTSDICRDLLNGYKKEDRLKVGATCQIISMCKNSLVEPSPDVIDTCLEVKSILLPPKFNKIAFYKFVQQVWDKVINDFSIIDFDDMLFLPVYHKMPVEKYLWTFADEVQDFNKCQIELLKRTVTKNLVAVGDRNQSCYAFRGAEAEAMDDIKLAFGADELTLSVTFRVPKAGVQHVNQEYPHIKFNCLDTAKEGSIETMPEEKLLSVVKDNDLVLCRMNAPLVIHVFALLREGRKATIIGRDLSNQLTSMVNRFSGDNEYCDVVTLLDRLNQYGMLEVGKLMNRGKEMQAEILRDKIQTIEALADGCQNAKCVHQRIKQIFTQTKGGGVSFSTVHRAKGLEANRVFVLKPELMPHPAAKKPVEKVQEINLQYIRDSRFIEELYFVKSAGV
jgi:DNA helicase-2/ATP-dependent DNA helicase PcrA